MAYLKRLQSCRQCGNAATYELRDQRNTTIDYYCDDHAMPALAKFRLGNEGE